MRIRYAKEERIKFISHQDEFRAWERALPAPVCRCSTSRASTRSRTSSSPRPSASASPACASRSTSPSRRRFPCLNCSERLAASLPPGLTVRDLAEVPLKTPALQSQLIGADYAIRLFAEADEAIDGEPVATAIGRIAALLQETEIWRSERQTLPLQPAPAILELAYQGYDVGEEHRIFLPQQQRPAAPDEVVAALGWTATRAHCAANVSTSPTMRTTRRSSPIQSWTKRTSPSKP